MSVVAPPATATASRDVPVPNLKVLPLAAWAVADVERQLASAPSADTFNRANENPLTGWIESYNDGNSTPNRIVSNQATTTNQSFRNTSVKALTPLDQEVYYTIAQGQGTRTDMRYEIYLRIASAPGGLFANPILEFTYQRDFTNPYWQIWGGSNLAVGILDTAYDATNLATGDKLLGRAIGPRYELWVFRSGAWTKLGSVTTGYAVQPTPRTGGYAGFVLVGNDSPARPAIDDIFLGEPSSTVQILVPHVVTAPAASATASSVAPPRMVFPQSARATASTTLADPQVKVPTGAASATASSSTPDPGPVRIVTAPAANATAAGLVPTLQFDYRVFVVPHEASAIGIVPFVSGTYTLSHPIPKITLFPAASGATATSVSPALSPLISVPAALAVASANAPNFGNVPTKMMMGWGV